MSQECSCILLSGLANFVDEIWKVMIFIVTVFNPVLLKIGLVVATLIGIAIIAAKIGISIVVALGWVGHDSEEKETSHSPKAVKTTPHQAQEQAISSGKACRESPQWFRSLNIIYDHIRLAEDELEILEDIVYARYKKPETFA
jgi:hypothetical protein